MMHTISWDAHEEHVDSLDAVERRLDQLQEKFRSGEPTLVTVVRANTGDSLSIGLGAELSVLNFVRGDKNPPYFTSAGTTNADGAISFRFGDEWSEYPLRAGVSIDRARAAVRRFCETGELSEIVTWEEG